MAVRAPSGSRNFVRPGGLTPVAPENYGSVTERKRSFDGCSLSRGFIEKLVRAGFIYTGVGDKVRCFKCGVVCSNWRQEDIPFNIHQQHNPFCRFLQTFTCKRKPPRDQMVIASSVSAWQRKTHLQLYRETTLQLYCCDGGQSVIQSFPANTVVDHNPACGLVYEDGNVDLMIPSIHPSPAHPLPLQSSQATDLSAVLIGNMLRPLQTHQPSAGIYKYPVQVEDINASVDLSSDQNGIKHERNGEDYICRICDNAPVKCVYLPCGHVGACRSCVSEFQKYSSLCPFCNTLVTTTHNVFFP